MTRVAKQKRRRWKPLGPLVADSQGVTLIEAMAGMLILSAGLLALLPLATISIDANEMARDTGDAAMSLQNQIERLRTESVITPGSELDPETGMYTQWWVETEPNGLQKVYVEVTWQTDLGMAHRQQAITYLYRDTTGGS